MLIVVLVVVLSSFCCVGTGAVAILYGLARWSAQAAKEAAATQESLAEEALTSGTPEERERAAVRLSQSGEQANGMMVRVLIESKDPGIRALCIHGLAQNRHYESMPLFLELLDDESPFVRARANSAVERMLGVEVGFRANDPPERRREAVGRAMQEWEKMSTSPAFEQSRRHKKPW